MLVVYAAFLTHIAGRSITGAFTVEKTSPAQEETSAENFSNSSGIRWAAAPIHKALTVSR
jgi:hypothetical protein